MPAPTTTAAAVKSALKVALLARPLITAGHVQVAYGEPTAVGRPECIWIGVARTRAPANPAAFRVGRRDEDYTLEVSCEHASSPAPEAAEARAVELAGEVEATVVDNTTLGVTGVAWVRPAGVELLTVELDTQPRSIAVVSLACKARLGP